MARILVWGAGAIGGTCGAYLKRAGHDISFVDVVPEHVREIRTRGLRITGPVDQFTVVAPAYEPHEVTGTWDRIFLAVKAQHTEAAVRALMPQVTRTLKTADQLVEQMSAPIERVAPGLARLADTLSSPQLMSFPNQLGDLLGALGDVAKRLQPLGQLAESAGGLFGLRPLTSLRAGSGAKPVIPPPSDEPVPAAERPAAKKPAARTSAAKKPAAKKPATKKPATKKPATKKPAAKKAR